MKYIILNKMICLKKVENQKKAPLKKGAF